MPASSAMRASRRLSGHEPDQRSGTRVTARPEEQFGPNRPILSALALYIAMRSRIEICGASTGDLVVLAGILHGCAMRVNGCGTAYRSLPGLPPPLPPPASGGGDT